MEPNIEQGLLAGMRAELEREATPADFPALPVIPGGRYTDPAFLALEQEYLWRRSWLYALHVDELPTPGSYRVWSKTGSPIVIVRGKDQVIRAFYNTCRHRGAPLIEQDAGETKGFFCRYHGWTYDLTGRLTMLREKRDFPGLDMSCMGLVEVRCEQFGNWVFINEDPDAEPLLQTLAPAPAHWASLGLAQQRHIHSASYDIECNVKILLDAFLETYHLKSIHPNTVDRFLDSHGTFVQLWPRGPRSMTVDVHWFAPEGAQGHELWPTRISNFERILEEDTQFAPRIQQSVETKGFRGIYLSYQERRIYQWHEELDRRIGIERIPEALRVPRLLDRWLDT
jgi:phenylpropionate dioxygenase-like ring-hydroxylating dioxygenase large terminal subunit